MRQYIAQLPSLNVPTTYSSPQLDIKSVTFLMNCEHYPKIPTELGVINITATEMKNLTSTQIATDEDEATVRLVASHMTHAADTVKRFYQHLQREKENVTVFNKISSSKRQAEEAHATSAEKGKKEVA